MTDVRSTSLRRAAALLVVGALTLAGCGGGSTDQDSAPDPEATSGTNAVTLVTTAPTSAPEPVGTEPTVTSTTSTTSTSTSSTPPTTPPTTSGEGAAEQSNEAYCIASRDYWVPIGALSFFALGDDAGVGRAFDELVARIQRPIDTAPSDAARRSAIDAQVVLTELTPLLAQIDFDPGRFDEIPAGGGDRGEALVVEFQSSQRRLGTFLLEQCGFDRSDLVDLARDFASNQATRPILEDRDPLPEPDTAVEPGTPSPDSSTNTDATTITDDSGTIEVQVPTAWVDVSGEPGPNEDRLVASSDRTGFLGGFQVPGVFIEAVDTPDGSGPDAHPVAAARIVENYTANGCVQQSAEAYSDPSYTGTEVTLSCVPGFETRLIAGTNASGTRIFVIVMVIEAGDSTTRDLIADSFLI